MTDKNPPLDIKADLHDADGIVDALPWRLGSTVAQRKASRGTVSALAHQVAALLAGGWSVEEVRTAFASVPAAADAPDSGAQERQWRAALKRANNTRRQAVAAPALPDPLDSAR